MEKYQEENEQTLQYGEFCEDFFQCKQIKWEILRRFCSVRDVQIDILLATCFVVKSLALRFGPKVNLSYTN